MPTVVLTAPRPLTAAEKLISKYESRRPVAADPYKDYALERRFRKDVRLNKQRRRYKK